MTARKQYRALYRNVQCAWCFQPVDLGDPITSWRRKPYHPGCYTDAKEACFTPVPF